ncbi:hypothetical protein COB57_02170 [Candidatus Peregrinibacteria bacterium]|nr:MAG: hypothetical protein COB57_02170 [Candidatus Peregrinibacteria bacterium]
MNNTIDMYKELQRQHLAGACVEEDVYFDQLCDYGRQRLVLWIQSISGDDEMDFHSQSASHMRRKNKSDIRVAADQRKNVSVKIIKILTSKKAGAVEWFCEILRYVKKNQQYLSPSIFSNICMTFSVQQSRLDEESRNNIKIKKSLQDLMKISLGTDLYKQKEMKNFSLVILRAIMGFSASDEKNMCMSHLLTLMNENDIFMSEKNISLFVFHGYEAHQERRDRDFQRLISNELLRSWEEVLLKCSQNILLSLLYWMLQYDRDISFGIVDRLFDYLEKDILETGENWRYFHQMATLAGRKISEEILQKSFSDSSEIIISRDLRNIRDQLSKEFPSYTLIGREIGGFYMSLYIPELSLSLEYKASHHNAPGKRYRMIIRENYLKSQGISILKIPEKGEGDIIQKIIEYKKERGVSVLLLDTNASLIHYCQSVIDSVDRKEVEVSAFWLLGVVSHVQTELRGATYIYQSEKDTIACMLDTLLSLSVYDDLEMDVYILDILRAFRQFPASQEKNELIEILLEVVEYLNKDMSLDDMSVLSFVAYSEEASGVNSQYQEIIAGFLEEKVKNTKNISFILSVIYWVSQYHSNIGSELLLSLFLEIEAMSDKDFSSSQVLFLRQIYSLNNKDFPVFLKGLYDESTKDHEATYFEREIATVVATHFTMPVYINIYKDGFELDVYIPELALNIECDGAQFHEGSGKRARAKIRDQYLLDQGITVIRWGGGHNRHVLITQIDEYIQGIIENDQDEVIQVL